MQEFAVILIGTSLVNNVVLTQFLGVSPLLAVAHRIDACVRLAGGTALVLWLATLATWLAHAWVLNPLGLDYLRIPVFALLAATIGQVATPLIDRDGLLLSRPGATRSLVIANAAVLGVALQNAETAHSFGTALLSGTGGAVGFALVMVLFAGLRERLEDAAVPAPFRGAAIGMVTAGLMSLAFMGFAGMD